MLTKTLILSPTYPAKTSPPRANGPPQRLRRQLATILHATSLTASLIAISLFSAAIPQWNRNFFHSTGPSRGDWTDGMPLGPLTVALLYHVVVLVSSHAPQLSSPQKTLGPKRSQIIHAVVSTLLLLSLFPALFLAGYGSLFRFWRPAMRTQAGVVPCTMLNVFARECEPVLYHVGTLQLGGIIFGSFVWTSHFALLLTALRNLRRHALIQQIQRDKLSQFSTSSSRTGSRSSSSHGSRRGAGSRKGSLRSVDGDHGAAQDGQRGFRKMGLKFGLGSKPTTTRQSPRSGGPESATSPA